MLCRFAVPCRPGAGMPPPRAGAEISCFKLPMANSFGFSFLWVVFELAMACHGTASVLVTAKPGRRTCSVYIVGGKNSCQLEATIAVINNSQGLRTTASTAGMNLASRAGRRSTMNLDRKLAQKHNDRGGGAIELSARRVNYRPIAGEQDIQGAAGGRRRGLVKNMIALPRRAAGGRRRGSRF